MTFSDLIGNATVKRSLEHMLESEAIPSTLLFYGMEGLSKCRFAMCFAKQLLGVDSSRKLENHPDLHVYFPEGKSGQHAMAAMKELIGEVHLPPFEAARKVFIIHDAERMPPPCSNALLKTLEEPNLDSVLILITSDPDKLLPTIVSRCRKIPFYPISEQEIALYVEKDLQKTKEEAHRIALQAQGSLSKAKSLSLAEEDPAKDLLLKILAFPSDYPALMASLTKLDKLLEADDEEGLQKFQRIDALLDQILYWYRDLHLLSCGGKAGNVFHLAYIEQLKEKSHEKIPSLERVLSLIGKVRSGAERHVKFKTCLEHFFLQI